MTEPIFRKTVVIDNTGMNAWACGRLKELSREVVFYETHPGDEDECIRRIGDADALMVSYRPRITGKVIRACPALRYIGMCCSLYSEESANVDIPAARENGISVRGIRDYGDEGVVEYVISDLVRLLHGFGGKQWKPDAYELTGQKVGIIGLGRTGRMVADALRFFGAEVYYYSRTRKPEAEEAGIVWKPLGELLETVGIVGTCLPRNTILLGDEEFRRLGHNKILFNTSVGVTFDVSALRRWLADRDNYFLCDLVGMGNHASELTVFDNVIFQDKVSGHSAQCMDRLSQKVIANAVNFLAGLSD